jgi:DNA-binding NarL/FixJ family response regulator
MLEHVVALLKAQFRILAAVTDGDAAIQETMGLKPDVVILDISMGTVGGIEVAQHLRRAGSISKIVFLTVHEDVEFLNAALGAGGSCYVIKQCMATDLVPAIDAALAGKLFVSSILMHHPPA